MTTQMSYHLLAIFVNYFEYLEFLGTNTKLSQCAVDDEKNMTNMQSCPSKEGIINRDTYNITSSVTTYLGRSENILNQSSCILANRYIVNLFYLCTENLKYCRHICYYIIFFEVLMFVLTIKYIYLYWFFFYFFIILMLCR